MISIDHKGHTVLVTGGAKGIGGGISRAFAQAGANVVIVYRSNPEESNAFAAALHEEFDTPVIAVQADMSREEDVVRAFDEAERAFGRVDILINNAGSNKTRYITDIENDEWDYYLKNNVTAYFLTTREFGRRNKDDGKGGDIVNILSKAAFSTTTRGRGAYVTNKHGELGLTRSAAVEFAPYKIYVNAIVPGFVWTPLTRSLGEEFTKKLSRAPMKCAAQPEELGQTAAFITSENCRLMVGSVVDLSGGLMLGF